MNTKRSPSLRRRTFAAAISIALVAALAFSPTVRAAFSGLLVQIGGMTFLEPDETERQATPLPESRVTLVPEEILPLDEARTKLPYTVSLPTWVPDGFRMSSSVRISYFPGGPPHASITWYDTAPNVASIELSLSGPQVQWLVETKDVQEVEVNGQPAALIDGTWSDESSQWDDQSGLTLTWLREDAMYQLYSRGMSREDLIRMAESIP